jgi:hypothetical protein
MSSPDPSARPTSHLSDRRRILRNQRIRGQQGDAFDHRLGDQDAVEGVLVDRRQAVERDGVLARDQQLAIAVIQKTATQPGTLTRKLRQRPPCRRPKAQPM